MLTLINGFQGGSQALLLIDEVSIKGTKMVLQWGKGSIVQYNKKSCVKMEKKETYLM